MRNWSAYNKADILDWVRIDAKRQGGSPPEPVLGIRDDKAQNARDSGKPWLYFDHAYFKRGYERGNFRACRDGLHLTRLIDRPADRLEKWGVTIEPWRKRGSEIIVIPPSEMQCKFYGCHDWLMKTESLLDQVTDRPVRCKVSKLPSLKEWLQDAWAVVTFASVAGVEAALMGIPVFSTENCPSYPVNAGRIDNIDSPEYPERHQWACGLTYATWNVEEMRNVKWIDYHYERLQ